MKRTLLVCLAIGVLLSVLVVVAGYYLISSPIDTEIPVRLEISPGDSVARLAEVHRGLINPLLFESYGRVTAGAGPIHVGEYELVPGMSLVDLFRKFRTGDVVQYRITFVEGWQFSQWREHLGTEPNLTQTITDQVDSEVMQRLGLASKHPEGLFFPDTYAFVRGTTDLDVLRRASERMNKMLEVEWQSRLTGDALRTTDEALILASIVEKESGYGPDRPKVAQVFLNRLRLGMRLQSDPTVIYGLSEGFDGNLKRRHLRAPNAYNTYTISGLPPTPICSPGIAAIRATLRPEPGNYLYFVAKGDGTSHFSVSLADHSAAVARFQLNKADDYRSSP